MTERRGEVLVLGFGNPARGDDALGPAVAAAIERAGLPGVTVDADYQLTVEDAEAVAAHDVVVFVDAACVGPEPFAFERLEPKEELGFSSHGCEPPAVLALARGLFDAGTAAYVLGIRGWSFEPFVEEMTDRAKANLAAATDFLLDVLKDRSFEQAARRARPADAADSEEPTCKTEST